MTARILIADDQTDILEALRLLLKGEGFETTAVTSPGAARRAVENGDFDLVLLDLNYTRDTTSGKEGLGLLGDLRQLDETLPVVTMTAWGSVGGAVEAMRRGARDYVEKPWDNERLLATIRTQVDLGRALRRAQRLETENIRLKGESAPKLIAESAAMRPVLEIIERVGPSHANVLITGEHGTGKEVVARRLHAVSHRCRVRPRRRERRRVWRRDLRERDLRTCKRCLHRRQDRAGRVLRTRPQGHPVSR